MCQGKSSCSSSLISSLHIDVSSGGCGERYCSEACRNKAWTEHHAFLCVGLGTTFSFISNRWVRLTTDIIFVHSLVQSEMHPLVLFKKYAIENSEVFLLGAVAIVKLIGAWLSQRAPEGDAGRDILTILFKTFHYRPWWDVSVVIGLVPTPRHVFLH